MVVNEQMSGVTLHVGRKLQANFMTLYIKGSSKLPPFYLPEAE